MAPNNESASKAKTAIPVYVSFLQFTGFLGWLQEMPSLPAQIDRSLWSARYSGSVGSQLMSGLRFLGLLDGEKPTDRLVELVRADENQRKEILLEVLQQAYGAELIGGVPTMTPRLFDDALGALGTTDATRSRAASFLTNALKDVGIAVPQTIAKRARNRPAGSGGRKTKATRRNTQPSSSSSSARAPVSQPDTAGVAHDTRTLQLRGGAAVSLSVDGDVLSLPHDDLVWLLGIVKQFEDYEAGPHTANDEIE